MGRFARTFLVAAIAYVIFSNFLSSGAAAQEGDDYAIVDCLLPGQIRQLGRNLKFLTPRRPVRTSQVDCEIRGGEYVSYDRANYSTALDIWLPQAQDGDPKAQTYLGEMAERGLGQAPDYEMAAMWYGRAAEQGYAPAQINLGQLYEKGLGVPKDMKTAINWYRRASGVDTADFDMVAFGDPSKEVKKLESSLADRTKQVEELQGQLVDLREELKRAEAERQSFKARLTGEEAALNAERLALVVQRQGLQIEKRELAKAHSEVESTPPFESGLATDSATDKKIESLSTALETERNRVALETEALQVREVALAREKEAFEERKREAEKAIADAHEQMADRLAKAEETLQERRRVLDEREAQIGEAAAELELSRHKEAEVLHSEHESVYSKLDKERNDLSKEAEDLKTLRISLEHRQQELDQKQKRIDEVVAAAIAEKLETLSNEKAHLQAQSTALEKREADLALRQQQLSAERMSAEAAMAADLEQRELQLASEAATIQKQAEELAHRESLLQVKHDALANQQQRQKDAILAEIEEQNGQLSKARAELNKRDGDLVVKEEALEAKRRALDQEMVKAKEKLAAEMDVRAQELAKERTELRLEADRLVSEEADLDEKRTQLSLEKRQQREELEASLAEHNQKIAKERADLQGEMEALAAREKDIALREQEIEAKRAKTEEVMVAKQQEWTQEIEQKERRLEELESQFSKREEEYQALNEHLMQLDTTIEKRRLQIATLDTTLEQNNGHESLDLTTNRPQIRIIEPRIHETRGEPVVYIQNNVKSRTIVGQVIAPQGLYQLLVNDQQISVNDKSLFQTKVLLQGDKLRVNVVAIDELGQRTELGFMMLADSKDVKQALSDPVTATFAKLPSANFGSFHALIIGNDDYRYLPDLRTPNDDATELAALLEQKYGFKTTVLLDATRTDIMAALNRFREELTENDNFVLYYAGHGELVDKNQRGHWLPIDAKVDDDTNWISNVQISDQLNLMTARKVLVIADSCYSGSLTRSTLARLDAGHSDEAYAAWLKLMITKKSRMALTSGELEPVLDGGGGRHSIFAQALIDALRENEEVLDGSTLHQIVSQSVSYAAGAVQVEQVPQYAPIKYAGHESGDFFFVPKFVPKI